MYYTCSPEDTLASSWFLNPVQGADHDYLMPFMVLGYVGTLLSFSHSAAKPAGMLKVAPPEFVFLGTVGRAFTATSLCQTEQK